MLVDIVNIGESSEIVIPKELVEKCGIKNRAEVEIEGESIRLKPILPRNGWEESFKKMNKNKDDELIIDDSLDIDSGDWTW